MPPSAAGQYRPPVWLPGGHLQTIYPALGHRLPMLTFRRERWVTPDGDFLDLDWQDGPASAPLLVLFHGLEGSSGSHYSLSLMHETRRLGWRGVVPHFRGCSGEPNQTPRAYHAGDSGEIDWILRGLRALHPHAPMYAAGVSLGGNMLLKWLGEQEHAATTILSAAASISAPVDLVAAGAVLDKGLNRQIYTREFMRTLKSKALHTLDRYPHLADRKHIEAASTFRDFDNFFTAPLHGYRDNDDYWLRASSKPLLRAIRVPTLLINARNDPFLPESALPDCREVSSVIELDFPQEGGHVGFMSGRFPGNIDWLPNRLLGFFRKYS